MTIVRPPFTKRELARALHEVLADRVAPGLDEVTPATLRDSGHARQRLIGLAHALLARGSYEFMGSRVGLLPRRDREPRKHAIATVMDGTVLKAITNALAHVWDQLPACMIGGRPGADHRQVIRAISRFLADGPCHGLRYDVKDAFGSAPFTRAIAMLRGMTDRQDLVDLIVEWRAAQRDDFAGLVEGSPVATLLLAVLLGMELVPHLQPYADLHVLWVDDGLLLARHEDRVHQARKVLDERLEAIQ